MGALIDAKFIEEKDTEDVIVGKIRGSLSDPTNVPVVYQLVRVDGDGRLVPATDDEVIEVENLLEDEKNEVPLVDGPCHSEGCVSSEVLTSKKSDFEDSEGLSQSKNSEINSRKLNARLQYIELMLQKVKDEERLLLSCESRHSMSKYMGINGIPSHHLNNPLACRKKLRSDSETTLLEKDTQFSSLNGSQGDQSVGVETCSEADAKPFSNGFSVSEVSPSSKTKISILKGEVCLDNLTVRELQEVFRASFGRETNVKDKSWLKRQIPMGLSNSCDLPVENFVLREKQVVNNGESEFEAGSLSTDQEKGSRNDSCLESSGRLTKQMEDHLILSGKRPSRSVGEYDANNDYLRAEQIADKRVRKPTKRYIEELSQVETGECTDTLSDSIKSGHGQLSPVSRTRSVGNIGSQGNTFVTRQDSLGGSHIQIRCVSRVRRGRPRTNFSTLMDMVGLEKEIDMMETQNSEEEQDVKHRKISSLGDISDENGDAMPAIKYVARRKHHRAWNLAEVMKLVEGVARYGTGRWSEIKRIAFASHAHRTSVDLKDKWRNLLKASFTKGPAEKGVRKHGSMPIPVPILSRVRQLAEIHSQHGVECSGGSKCSGHSELAVQKNSSGFV